MGRQIRHVRPGGAVFEITTRCLQGRYLLPIGEPFRRLAVGIMARAQKLYPVQIYAFGGLRNYLHLLIGVNNVADLYSTLGHARAQPASTVLRIKVTIRSMV